jgi:ubiquinone/menaquinone biosynthesis C-methylase UbiE
MEETVMKPTDKIQAIQANHRTILLDIWSIQAGAKIVEIGCGQGDCTEALALRVGPEGHIDALDPAPLDYGSPETLGQAQSRISASDIGSFITWHQKSPQEFLISAKSGKYDIAVLCHSLWYHSSPAAITETLSALKGKANKLCIAEYALVATEPSAIPHVLAALTRAAFETHMKESEANIRTAIAPNAIQEIAEAVGWKLVNAERIVPGAELQDGSWETATVVSENFMQEVKENIKDEKVKELLNSMRESVKSASEILRGSSVQTMDVWVATFG